MLTSEIITLLSQDITKWGDRDMDWKDVIEVMQPETADCIKGNFVTGD